MRNEADNDKIIDVVVRLFAILQEEFPEQIGDALAASAILYKSVVDAFILIGNESLKADPIAPVVFLFEHWDESLTEFPP